MGLRGHSIVAFLRLSVVLLIGVACYGYVVQTTRAAMTQPASAATAPPPVLGATSLKLPSATSPTPVAIASVLPTLRQQTPAPVVYAPPPVAKAASAALPRMPSPKEEVAEQERRRVLEARSASSQVTFDSDARLAQQTARDTADLAHGSAMVAAAKPKFAQTAATSRRLADCASGRYAQIGEYRCGPRETWDEVVAAWALAIAEKVRATHSGASPVRAPA